MLPQENLLEPQLQYGEDFTQGPECINAYLDTLEAFVKTWYEDCCDKYEFN